MAVLDNLRKGTGSSLFVDKLIKQYTVASGGNISAGDFVRFVNDTEISETVVNKNKYEAVEVEGNTNIGWSREPADTSTALTSAGSTLTANWNCKNLSAVNFNGGTIIVYCDEANSRFNAMSVTLDGASISTTSPKVLGTAMNGQSNLCKINDDQAVIVYSNTNDSNSPLTCTLLTYSSSAGDYSFTSATFDTDCTSSGPYHITKINDSKFLVTYSAYNSADRAESLKCIIGNITTAGNITFGEEVIMDSTGRASSISAVLYNTNKIVIGYTLSSRAYLMYVDVTGEDASVHGSRRQINVATSNSITVERVDATSIVAYYNNTTNDGLYGRVFTARTLATVGLEYCITPAAVTDIVSLPIAADETMVSYTIDTSLSLMINYHMAKYKIVNATVDGISWEHERDISPYDDETTCGYKALTFDGSNSILAIWYNDNDYKIYGTFITRDYIDSGTIYKPTEYTAVTTAGIVTPQTFTLVDSSMMQYVKTVAINDHTGALLYTTPTGGYINVYSVNSASNTIRLLNKCMFSANAVEEIDACAYTDANGNDCIIVAYRSADTHSCYYMLITLAANDTEIIPVPDTVVQFANDSNNAITCFRLISVGAKVVLLHNITSAGGITARVLTPSPASNMIGTGVAGTSLGVLSNQATSFDTALYDDTHFVLVHAPSLASEVCVGTVDGNTVTFGASVSVGGPNVTTHRIARLNDNDYCVVCCNVGSIYCTTVTISGTTVSEKIAMVELDTEVGASLMPSIHNAGNGKVIINYINADDNKYPMYLMLDVTDTTIALAAPPTVLLEETASYIDSVITGDLCIQAFNTTVDEIVNAQVVISTYKAEAQYVDRTYYTKQVKNVTIEYVTEEVESNGFHVERVPTFSITKTRNTTLTGVVNDTDGLIRFAGAALLTSNKVALIYHKRVSDTTDTVCIRTCTFGTSNITDDVNEEIVNSVTTSIDATPVYIGTGSSSGVFYAWQRDNGVYGAYLRYTNGQLNDSALTYSLGVVTNGTMTNPRIAPCASNTYALHYVYRVNNVQRQRHCLFTVGSSYAITVSGASDMNLGSDVITGIPSLQGYVFTVGNSNINIASDASEVCITNRPAIYSANMTFKRVVCPSMGNYIVRNIYQLHDNVFLVFSYANTTSNYTHMAVRTMTVDVTSGETTFGFNNTFRYGTSFGPEYIVSADEEIGLIKVSDTQYYIVCKTGPLATPKYNMLTVKEDDILAVSYNSYAITNEFASAFREIHLNNIDSSLGSYTVGTGNASNVLYIETTSTATTSESGTYSSEVNGPYTVTVTSAKEVVTYEDVQITDRPNGIATTAGTSGRKISVAVPGDKITTVDE